MPDLTDDQTTAQPATANGDGLSAGGEGDGTGETAHGDLSGSLTDLVGLDPNLTGGVDAAEYAARQNCDHGDELDALRRMNRDLAAELAHDFTARMDTQLTAAEQTGEPPDVSQIHIRDLDVATPDELRAEIHRLDRRLRWAQAHYDAQGTGHLLATFKLGEERDDLHRKVEAVRALHERRTVEAFDGYIVTFDDCAHCDRTWPCPTIQALGGEAS